jgi:hypothetical protein
VRDHAALVKAVKAARVDALVEENLRVVRRHSFLLRRVPIAHRPVPIRNLIGRSEKETTKQGSLLRYFGWTWRGPVRPHK